VNGVGVGGTPSVGGSSAALGSPYQKLSVQHGSIDSGSLTTNGNRTDEGGMVARENPRKLFIRDPLVSPITSKPQIPEALRGSTPVASSSLASSQKLSDTKLSHGGVNGMSSKSTFKELTFASPQSTIVKAQKPTERIGQSRSSLSSPGSPGTKTVVLSDSMESRGLPRLPTLRSRDYYTEPSLGDLAKWARSDPSYLEAVPNFLVGRKGYGELRFLEPVDLRGVPVDTVVQFGDKEVRVYMDSSSSKPPPGEGLNKPATITLFNVHKLDKDTGEVVTDKEKVEGFVRKLRLRAEAQGAKFVSYQQESSTRNPKGGDYTFEVDHFSKYDGFVDDSSDDEEGEMNAVKGSGAGFLLSRTRASKENRNLVQSMAIDSNLVSSELLHLNEGNDNMGGKMHADGGLKAWKTHSWKTSPSPLKTPTRVAHKALGMKDDTPYTSFQSSDMHDNVEICQVASVPTQDNYTATVVTGPASALIGSFRVGWGPGGWIAHSGTWGCNASIQNGNASVVNIEQVHTGHTYSAQPRSVLNAINPKQANKDKQVDFCTRCLDANLAYMMGDEVPVMPHPSLAPISSVPDVALPRLCLNVSSSSLKDLCAAYCTVIDESCPDSSTVDGEGNMALEGLKQLQFSSIWHLLVGLFGSLSENHDDSSVEGSLLRKKNVSDWLRDHANWAFKREVAQSTSAGLTALDKVILNLARHNLQGAIKHCLNGNDVRLASLIAFAGSHEFIKESVQEQLKIWEEESMQAMIDGDRLLVYELLSGKLDSILSPKTFDWRRCLAMIMWYSCRVTDPVQCSLDAFKDLYDKGVLSQPSPAHVEFGKEEDIPGINDTAFELLNFAYSANKTDLDCLLKISGYSRDTLDYSLSWHMLSVLEALGIVCNDQLSPADQATVLKVHLGYLHQLEIIGANPKWLIYVALHIPSFPSSPFLREATVSDVLVRTAPLWIDDADARTFMTGNLHMPEAWIHGAEALWCKYTHRYGDEFGSLVRAGAYTDAQLLFTKRIGPDAFVAECRNVPATSALSTCSFKELRHLFEQLVSIMPQGKIQDPTLSLYRAFLMFMEKQQKGASEISERDLGDLFDALGSEGRRTVDSVEKRVVLSKMTSILAEAYRLVQGHAHVGESRASHMLSKVGKCMEITRMSHVLPENALNQVQDAAACLSYIIS